MKKLKLIVPERPTTVPKILMIATIGITIAHTVAIPAKMPCTMVAVSMAPTTSSQKDSSFIDFDESCVASKQVKTPKTKE